MRPNLSIIIVNYNTADLIVKCLASIQSQKNALYEVIVVDNASQDNSVDLIRRLFPWAKLIINEINCGFSKANNQGIKISQGEYIFFLNPDTEVRPGCFTAAVDYMKSHPEIALAGTKIYYPDNSPQSSVEYRYPGQRHAHQDLIGLQGDIAWLLGASIISRRSVIEKVGGFDEDFFLYGEDIDLCLSVRKKGLQLGFIENAEIVHWEGQSEKNNLPADVLRKKFRAELNFYKKHYTVKTIKRIKWANIIKAYWRIITLFIVIPFSKDKTAIRQKKDKYTLAAEMFRKI